MTVSVITFFNGKFCTFYSNTFNRAAISGRDQNKTLKPTAIYQVVYAARKKVNEKTNTVINVAILFKIILLSYLLKIKKLCAIVTFTT